jgi:hypothetical protein
MSLNFRRLLYYLLSMQKRQLKNFQVELLDIQCDSILRQKFCEVPLLPNLTISAPLIRRSNSMLFLILHIYFAICIGPNIFRRICLSKMRRRISSFSVTVQVSEAYATTGLMRVRYIIIFILLFNNFDFKVLHLRNRLYFLFIFFQQFQVVLGYLHSIWIPGMKIINFSKE